VMELRREDRRLVGNLRYRIRQSLLSEQELDQEFTVRGVPELSFRDAAAPPGTPGLTVVAEGWHKADEGWFATAFIADPPLAELLAGATEVDFSALPGSRVPAIAPRARLSTRGFASALKALER